MERRSSEQFAARKARKAEEGSLAMKEHLAREKEINENTARLRALRLAKEAAATVPEKRGLRAKTPKAKRQRAG
jgi:hypothetical protein